MLVGTSISCYSLCKDFCREVRSLFFFFLHCSFWHFQTSSSVYPIMVNFFSPDTKWLFLWWFPTAQLLNKLFLAHLYQLRFPVCLDNKYTLFNGVLVQMTVTYRHNECGCCSTQDNCQTQEHLLTRAVNS